VAAASDGVCAGRRRSIGFLMRDQLLHHLSAALPEALGWLRRMVSTNSFTTHRAGVDAVGDLTADCFVPLGFRAERLPSVNPLYGHHLILTRPGRSGRKIGFISHLDTVFTSEEEIRQQFAWRVENERIYGPGTMDIKGGTIMIYLVLTALRKVAPLLFEEITWIVLANSSEEVLSRDFGQICLQRLHGGLAALVFEAGGQVGKEMTVVTARKGRATFQVTVDGHGAHAGSRHERGANAIVQLAEVVQRIAALTNYERALTFNVGSVNGGTVVNRVPHLAVAEVEMRAFTLPAYEEGMKAMMALHGHSTVTSREGDHRCRVAVRLGEETPPWPDNPGTQSLFNLWRTAAAATDSTLAAEQRGGVSDGNYLWQALPTIDGLGPYGDNAHCSEQSADGSKVQEYADVSSFVPRAAITALALHALATQT